MTTPSPRVDFGHLSPDHVESRRWIAPLFYVPVTFEAFKTKRDAAMETIVAFGKE